MTACDSDDDGGLSDVSDTAPTQEEDSGKEAPAPVVSRNRPSKAGNRKALVEKWKREAEVMKKRLEEASRKRQAEKKKEADRQQRHEQGLFSSDEDESGLSDVSAEGTSRKADAKASGGSDDGEGGSDDGENHLTAAKAALAALRRGTDSTTAPKCALKRLGEGAEIQLTLPAQCLGRVSPSSPAGGGISAVRSLQAKEIKQESKPKKRVTWFGD
eukprot:TRINITY_DN46101_c0_g1_i1.p1 TRINITY_DN46101_c0_g1~~TRINITY_DN46101_c0_g1_i1.p1  ORF type:complete len:215 (+),score=56.85 TRINITY_DN46101_c0_g1_i1:89-733(+)